MANSTKPPTDDRGRSARSPWRMPLSAWKDIAKRTWHEATSDNIGLVAAGVAFYAFLAIVPLLGATVLTYGLLASPDTVLANMKSLTQFLPQTVAGLIGDQLMNVVQTSSGKKGFGVVVALAVTLFGARNAAGSVVTALNIAYEEVEKRGFIHVTLLALAITLAAVVLALLAVTAIGVIRFLEALLPGVPGAALLFGKLLTPLLIAAGAAAAAATLYRYGPSREKAEWTWMTPGSLLSGVGWLVVTAGFGFYVTRFANYEATYGSLGAVVALLTWIYLSSYVFLFGAELNSEVEHQTAVDSTAGADQPPGARGAWSADHVADDAAGSREQALKDGKPTSEEQPSGAGTPDMLRKRAALSTADNAEHPYLASRLANRGGRLAGLGKVGMISSVLATTGLGLLRRRGKAGAGAALLTAAATLAFLRREED